MSRRLSVHDVITIAEKDWVILDLKHREDQAVCYCAKTQKPSTMSIRELRRKLAWGEATSNAPAASRGLLQNFDKESPQFSKYLANVEIVNTIKKLVNDGNTRRQAILIATETGIKIASGETIPMCSPRQVYRLLKLGSEHQIGLMPNYPARGNRCPRYGERMAEITMEVIRDQYAQPKTQITLPFVTEIVTRKAHAEGILKLDEALSNKYILSVMKENWSSDLDYNRLDPRLAKSLKAVAKHRIKSGGPLDRVEIDTLHLPFKATLDGEKIENIWVMLAIDCGTSMPLAWWLMTASPTTDDTFSCLERAIYPKGELLKELGIDCTVDPYGSILNLVMDNGPEFSKDRMPALTALNVNLIWTAKDSGHEKPFVERLNRSIKEGLQSLPGCTRFNGKDGKRTEADMYEDLMEIKELNRWIGRWLYEFWPNKPLERFITADYEIDKDLGITPAERWTKSEELCSLPSSPYIEDWRRVKFLTAERKLSAKTGISFKGFTFRGKNLQLFIRQFGAETTVQIHYDPHDYRTIYVADKIDGSWKALVNDEVGRSTPAYSFDNASRKKTELRATHRSPEVFQNFKNDLVDRSIQKPTKKDVKEAARKHAKDDARTRKARSKAEENPLPESTPLNPASDTFVTPNASTKFVKHKKSEWGTK